MRVILSVSPVRFPLTGIGRYTYELARSLGKSEAIESLLFFNGTRFVSELPDEPNARRTEHWFRQLVARSPAAVGLAAKAAGRVARRALRGYADHIYHSPNYYLPEFGGRCVATFHDLSIYKWPDCHPPERVRYMRGQLDLALKRADMLLTDSEYVCREVIDYFGWPEGRIRSVPLACSTDFRPRSHDEVRGLLARFALDYQGYSLYAGTMEPRKNLDTLLLAYSRLPEPVRRRWPLVLAGYQGWGSGSLHDRIDAMARQGWLRYLGYVSSSDLPGLFAGARSFLFPSLYEGFGLPVLEAMASGVPVVCSDASSLPEVVGDCALTCPATDVDGLGTGIQEVLENDDMRRSLAAKGRERAACFSWERCAFETIEAYRCIH